MCVAVAVGGRSLELSLWSPVCVCRSSSGREEFIVVTVSPVCVSQLGLC